MNTAQTQPSHITAAPIEFATDQRRQAFEAWFATVASVHALRRDSLVPASADASFRRYFRVQSDKGLSHIIMDAPPEKENCAPFVHIAKLMHEAKLHVPQIQAWDEAQGFMLLSDLGQQTMLEAIQQADSSDAQKTLAWYIDAVEALVNWQAASKPGVLPAYDEALLRREIELYPEWYVGQHLRHRFSAEEMAVWQSMSAKIIAHNLASAPVYVHRDFMPRNLMISTPTLGVLDFQDAVYGPISYDIACLMRDAFLSWPEDFVIDITVRYWQAARAAGLPVPADFGEFYKAMEWMGLQRHLKVLGIFARINYRDGKPKYLGDTPRFISYVLHTAQRYPELSPLGRLVKNLEGIKEKSAYTF
jgi:N-acetylmuramate 1-kinase